MNRARFCAGCHILSAFFAWMVREHELQPGAPSFPRSLREGWESTDFSHTAFATLQREPKVWRRWSCLELCGDEDRDKNHLRAGCESCKPTLRQMREGWGTRHGASPVGDSDTSAMPGNYVPTKGDIAVFSGGAPHNPIGHMEIYNGKHWVSDTTQTTFSPGHHYPGSVTVYRFPQQ
jgi:hypothetical protein